MTLTATQACAISRGEHIPWTNEQLNKYNELMTGELGRKLMLAQCQEIVNKLDLLEKMYSPYTVLVFNKDTGEIQYR